MIKYDDFKLVTEIKYKGDINGEFKMLCIAKEFRSFIYVLHVPTNQLFLTTTVSPKSEEYDENFHIRICGCYRDKTDEIHWYGTKNYESKNDCYMSDYHDEIVEWWNEYYKRILVETVL